jgi:hypothetical protein
MPQLTVGATVGQNLVDQVAVVRPVDFSGRTARPPCCARTSRRFAIFMRSDDRCGSPDGMTRQVDDKKVPAMVVRLEHFGVM